MDKKKPGLELADGSRIDVSAFGEDYNELFGSDGINRLTGLVIIRHNAQK